VIVELLYTVQVSFREHTLVPKPFLIVALIAVTRRILVVTAEFAELAEAGGRLPARHAGARAPHDHGAGFVVALVLFGSAQSRRCRSS
jgi:Phosphate-starvation-inducible E family